ncbi:sigma-70 family RNA polymerase sigma factor [Flavobacteriaceae bacterium R38]|nr:sigma-70 family RNA polymerase sigma factor [Flavobacteriaceae bacterium R38]
MESLTDEELMILVVNGNIDMMRHLFNRYHVKIFNYFLMMTKNREISQDMTQEVFYKIIKYSSSYKKTKFTSWMYAIARNICNDYYQNTKNREVRLNEIEFKIGETDVNTPERKETTEQLNRILDQLSKSDKELIIMSRYQGIKYREIAEITDSSVGAVKTKIHRIIQKLRSYYFQNVML